LPAELHRPAYRPASRHAKPLLCPSPFKLSAARSAARPSIRGADLDDDLDTGSHRAVRQGRVDGERYGVEGYVRELARAHVVEMVVSIRRGIVVLARGP